MKFLIVGLGNIGVEYYGTRHNIGFRMINAVAEAVGASFVDSRYGAIALGRMKNAELILLKPSTYMNLSGEAVRYWMKKENIPLENILVLVDDLALDFGTMRLKAKGSDAGHNGLKNIALLLNTVQYARLRFGLGSSFSKGGQVDFVLGKFTPEEESAMPLLMEEAVAIVRDFCLIGVDRAMNLHNKKEKLS
ncbi:aminoacyl-tRNA hydrolase [Porphyromonas circumdentaria]|uniref:Peptidyl-tRNA hydrolase n=1 Tax=Porphyromonas circumdentaria TaxID=29524 RepID=A0A1T4KXU2_9PORP|nr:aminoacyl-tRNA hydrolase [Porphyromonas circumdentaria]MBB6275123.1 PTH1 family peptidyl-tRNA hydrolase [Porphyromonas circumdentaria]MDO4722905.1 aminoacyl-tRNA hydrolase [Porphyromonas circumdentaria]SJZ47173.1 peptidyl-tRNA hydrolase [Porphyromonas circumdentaria]